MTLESAILVWAQQVWHCQKNHPRVPLTWSKTFITLFEVVWWKLILGSFTDKRHMYTLPQSAVPLLEGHNSHEQSYFLDVRLFNERFIFSYMTGHWMAIMATDLSWDEFIPPLFFLKGFVPVHLHANIELTRLLHCQSDVFLSVENDT